MTSPTRRIPITSHCSLRISAVSSSREPPSSSGGLYQFPGRIVPKFVSKAHHIRSAPSTYSSNAMFVQEDRAKMAIPPYPHFGPNIRSKRPTILNPEIVTDSTSTDNHVSCKSKMSTPAFFKRASSSARLRRSFLQFTLQIPIFVKKTQLVGSITRRSVLTLQRILSEVCNEFRIMVLVPLGAPETGTAPDKVPGAPSCSEVK